MGCLPSGQKVPDDAEEKTRESIAASRKQPAKTTKKLNISEDTSLIINKKYKLGAQLGSGASCYVYFGERKTDNMKTAIKVLSKQNSESQKFWKHEINILSKLDHPNVLKMIESLEDDSNYYIVTEYCDGGELLERILSRSDRFADKDVARLVRSILETVSYCHSQGIVHRDIKCENFCFLNKSEDSPLILIDFGVAKIVDDNTEYSDITGTPYYFAPELVVHHTKTPVPRNGKCFKGADLWSIGVVAYVMQTGRFPFNATTAKRRKRDIYKAIVTQELRFPSQFSHELSKGYKNFVRSVLKKHPNNRITMDQALNDPWVQGISARDIKIHNLCLKYLKQFNYVTKLKKVICRALAENIDFKQEQTLKAYFNKIDKDGNETLNAEEIEKLLLTMGRNEEKAKEDAIEIIEKNDENNDKVIDFNEFKTTYYRILLSEQSDLVKRVFTVFDDNSDGFIDVDELKTILKNQPNLNFHAMIAEVDKNNDGKLNFEEFAVCMREEIEKGDIDFEQIYEGAQNVGSEPNLDETIKESNEENDESQSQNENENNDNDDNNNDENENKEENDE